MNDQGKSTLLQVMPHLEWLQQGKLVVNVQPPNTIGTTSQGSSSEPNIWIDFTKTFFDARFGIQIIS